MNTLTSAIKRIGLVALAAVILLCSACGTAIFYQPAEFDIGDAGKSPSVNDEHCVLYFDNTQSMAGYAAASNSNFVRTIAQLYEIMINWKTHQFNALRRDAKGILHWEDIATQPGNAEDIPYHNMNFKEAFRNWDPKSNSIFYTYEKPYGKNRAVTFGDKKLGPLHLLFPQSDASYKSPIDYSVVNVVITDLLEQDMELTRLARNIKEEMNKNTDHSATLFCIRSFYDGIKYVNDSSTANPVNPMDSRLIKPKDGPIPFYIMLFGPRKDMLTLANALETFLKGNLPEEYNRIDFFSSGGLTAVETTDADDFTIGQMVGGDADKDAKNHVNSVYLTDNSKQTINLFKTEQKVLFPSSTKPPKQPSLYFQYDPAKSGQDACLNIYVPLPTLIGETDKDYASAKGYRFSADGYELKLAAAGAEEPVSEAVSEQEPTTTQSTDETTAENNFQVGAWTLLEGKDAKKYAGVQLFPISAGDSVQPVDFARSNSNRQLIYMTEAEPWFKAPPSGAVRIFVHLTKLNELKKDAKNGLIAIGIPVTVYRAIDKEPPQWMSDMTYTAQMDPGQRFFKTEGLTGIYTTMSDSYIPSGEKEWRKTILELVINIKL